VSHHFIDEGRVAERGKDTKRSVNRLRLDEIRLNCQMKPKIARVPSPDITAFRTSRRPKNPVTVDKNLPVDTFVHSPQIALEPETFDVPSNEALAASIDLEIGKGSSLDDVVNSSAELLSMDLTYLDVGPISLTEDPQLELSGLLPSISNPTDIAREVLTCLANGDLNECEEKESDDRPDSNVEDSDESSGYDNESCVGSSTGDLTTEESESDYEEHIVGLNKLHENSRPAEQISSKKTSTFAEAETVSLDSCDEDVNETSNLRVRGDKNGSPHIPSNNPSSLETENSEPLIGSSDFCQFSPKNTSVSSPQKNPAAESSADKDSADYISDKSCPSQANSNKFKFSKSSPSPCSSPSPGSSKNELKSPKPSPWEATPPGESSPEKPDSSLPQATQSPDEFQKNNPSTNFSENFADYMSLSSLGSFGSSLYFSKETVPTLVTFKREVPLEGESDPFADMGINLEDLVQVCATPADIITDPSAPPLYPFPSPDGSQSFSISCDHDSHSCSAVENYDSIPVQSSTLSTSSGNLLLDNLGHLHKSVGTSPKSSALFGVPLVISAQRSTAVEISDCHVSSTQECSATPVRDDNTSCTSSPRKRHPSQIVTNRSDDESDDEVMFISRQQLVDPLARDIEEISEVAQEIIARSDDGPIESRNEIQSTTHASVENETNEIVPSSEQLNTPITLHPLTSTGNIHLKSSEKEILNYANEISLLDNADNPKLSQAQHVPVDSHCNKQLEKAKEVRLVVCSNDHSSNAKNSIEALSESQEESHIEVESLSSEPEKRNPVEGVASSISSTQKELTVVESIQSQKKRRPGPASKTRIVVKPTVPDSPKRTPVTTLMTSPKISEEASSTSATLEIATVKFSIPSKPDHLSVVPMKPLNASPCKSSRMWLYSAEHKLSLYGEGKFLVDREHLKNYEGNSIPVWRIWKTRKLLQKFVPIEIDGRCFHQGVDEFRLFPDVEDELYIKYQPIIFDVWIDTKSHQLGIYYSVIGSYPYLGYFPLTVHLHDDFKDFLQRMACRAMSDKVKRGVLVRKDNETFQDVINSHLKEIIVAECFPQAFPVEVLIQAIEYPRMINTRSQVKKNVSCCSCERMGRSKQSYFTAIFDGDLYDHITFHLTKKEGHGKQSALQFCRPCTKYLIAFHRIVHYKFWLFIAFRLQLRKLYLELKEGQKFHPDDVLKFLTGDFHFNKMCFYEFQAVYSEGCHCKDRLQKEIILLGKKQKGPSDPFRNTSDSTELIKTFQKSIKGLFCKSRNPQHVQAPTLCIETAKVTPVKTGLENQAKGRKQVKRKKLLDERQKQPETELPGSLQSKDLSQDQKKSTALKSGSHVVDNSSTKDCETRKAPTKKSRKRDLSKSDGKVLNSQLVASGQIETCETHETISVTAKKTKLSTSTGFVPNKAMLKQTTHLEPPDSTSSSSTRRSKSNKEKPSVATKNKARVASPSLNAMGPPPKRRKVQKKNKRQLLKSGKSTRGKIPACPTSSSRDSEMDMVIETTKEISEFMEQFQQVSDESTEDAVAKVSSHASLDRHGEGDVFELLSIEFVS
ncbi:unnamed protein product, partial [Allacma fusca]